METVINSLNTLPSHLTYVACHHLDLNQCFNKIYKNAYISALKKSHGTRGIFAYKDVL